MNDERFLKDWLQDTTDSSSDPNVAADKVVARLPETSQRRRWLPWPPARRTRTDTATNGRTRFMFSLSKTFAAAALAFAVGGAYVVTTTTVDERPGASGEAAVPFEPVEFTGIFTPGPELTEATVEVVDNRVESRGAAWTPTIVQVSDDRLDGTLIYAADEDRYSSSGHVLTTVTYRIENDEGAWQGSTVELALGGDDLANSVVLMGEGAYDGLVAVMEQSDGIVRGAIFPAHPPTASDLPLAPKD